MSENLNQQIEIKEKIERLINQGLIDEASKELIKNEDIIENEKWKLTTKSVINILKGDINSAEEILKGGLIKYPFTADILFNLAYIYEQKHDFQSAYDFYLDAKDTLNKNEKVSAELALNNLKNKSVDLIEKEKIAVFIKPGLDNFIDEIISGLSDRYRVRKILVSSYEQIDQGMDWADICWFEWCDELVMYGSNNELAINKKIICRLHGYEVYTKYINNVKWETIDHLIIVAPHIKRIFREKIDPIILNENKVSIIYCGIDEKVYPFSNKKKGYNIGYLGYINYKKNIPLSLKIFYDLYKKDKRYKFYLAGQFQDERVFRYVDYFIKSNKLENNIFIEGWKNFDEKINWLKKIDYILISSIDEGLCYAAAESMLTGIKPVLHNCEGINDHYVNKYIYNTVEEATQMIESEIYSSIEYRSFIEEYYSKDKEIKTIKSLLKTFTEI
ncbi:glycosyltransferase [Lysinibacillus sp. BW-2-10]|uniref:glycosyltransferase n=1 Tax=Lysinibacillus sp. BW-2-10 TaxID=2590030 RepID=UPI0011815FA9|nr:glycosyltransferase [Lysinibacillus sp. BW-2-10]TSI07320.1 glycosyltransferase family 4 protein [Lysinibacillus sp. BW-2-10]